MDLLFPTHTIEATAITCLILASKFDELDDNIPMIAEFHRAFQINQKMHRTSRRAIKKQDLFACEIYILGVLNWDLNSTSFFSFLQNYVYQGILFSDD